MPGLKLRHALIETSALAAQMWAGSFTGTGPYDTISALRCLLGILAVAFVTLVSTGARAGGDDAQRLIDQGKQRVQAKDYAGALALFKKSLALRERPETKCYVGGAYYMLKRWVPAHLYLGLCLSRATELDDAAWVKVMSELYAKAETKLKSGAFAPVKIRVTPATARVHISALPADTSFVGSRTVWLRAGKHRVTATANNHDNAATSIDVVAGTPAEVALTLKTKPTSKPLPPVIEPPSRTASYVSWGLGGAGLIAGAVYYVLARDTSDRASPLDPNSSEYADLKSEFEFRRLMSYSLLGAGVIATAIGTYLVVRANSATESSRSAAGAIPTRGGALVWARWSF